jgi:hypothetical protein
MVSKEKEDYFVAKKLADKELNQLVVCDVADISQQCKVWRSSWKIIVVRRMGLQMEIAHYLNLAGILRCHFDMQIVSSTVSRQMPGVKMAAVCACARTSRSTRSCAAHPDTISYDDDGSHNDNLNLVRPAHYSGETNHKTLGEARVF